MTRADSSLDALPEGRAGRAFEERAEPFRRAIKLHCYRMLGSQQEAEDAVQEAYLRAWRSFDRFEEGSFRAWLYRIATNVCLNAIDGRKLAQRLLPDQLAPAATTIQMPDGAPPTEIAWLEPYPDADIDGIADDAPDPEARYTARESVQLAFVAAIQTLPPRQRAALLLCDVLGWAAGEAATLLGGSTASINSALQRARETLSRRHAMGQTMPDKRPDAGQQKLLDRYVAAWEGHDLDGFVALLKEDASFTMPPWQLWFFGRQAIGSFFAIAWQHCDGMRMVPTAANGQPAFGLYQYSSAEDRWNARALHVLTLEDGAIATLTAFELPSGPQLLPAFGLPLVLPGNP